MSEYISILILFAENSIYCSVRRINTVTRQTNGQRTTRYPTFVCACITFPVSGILLFNIDMFLSNAAQLYWGTKVHIWLERISFIWLQVINKQQKCIFFVFCGNIKTNKFFLLKQKIISFGFISRWKLYLRLHNKCALPLISQR